MILEFASGVTGYVLAAQTTELLNSKLNESLYRYTNVTDIKELWDAVQKEVICLIVM